MLMEDDVVWKQAVTKQLDMLRCALGSLAEKLHMPELQLATQEVSDLDQLLVSRTQRESSANSSHDLNGQSRSESGLLKKANGCPTLKRLLRIADSK